MGRKRMRSPPRALVEATSDFLADAFPTTRPLKVQLSALRSSQARILTRNLRAAGATVLSRSDIDEKVQSSPTIVVTDTVPEEPDESVTYVPPRWAHEVLKRRRCLSPTRFKLVIEPPSPVASPKDSDDEKPVRVPAVWQFDTAERADAKLRARWLRALPAYAVERATYTECVHKSPNGALARALRDVARVRELLAGANGGGDGAMRGQAYKNAAAALSALPFEVRAIEAALVRDVGQGVAEAVREFIVRGEVREAALLRRDERLRALDELSSVYGIGMRTAQRLFEAGVRTTMQLQEYAKRDGARALLRGVYLPTRPYAALTREQAAAFRDAVALAMKTHGLRMRVTLCGGYRRCKSKGHDVDLVYCRDGVTEAADCSPLHPAATRALQAAGLLRARLHQEGGGFKARSYGYTDPTNHAKPQRCMSHEVMHAVCEHEGRLFRVDFVGVRDSSEYCFATLAWSGSVAFQRSLRRYSVARAGLVFSAHGLFDAHTGVRAQIAAEARTEHDVFNSLGLTYRPPFERAA